MRSSSDEEADSPPPPVSKENAIKMTSHAKRHNDIRDVPDTEAVNLHLETQGSVHVPWMGAQKCNLMLRNAQ